MISCFQSHLWLAIQNSLRQGFWYFTQSQSGEFQVNPWNPTKFARNLTKYMLAQHIGRSLAIVFSETGLENSHEISHFFHEFVPENPAKFDVFPRPTRSSVETEGNPKIILLRQKNTKEATANLGPDYMSRAGPVSRAGLVWAGPVVM